MLTLMELEYIRCELNSAITFMEDIAEQFSGHEKEQFGDEDIQEEINRKKYSLAMIDKAMEEMKSESNDTWNVLREFLEGNGDCGMSCFIMDSMNDVAVNDFVSLNERIDDDDRKFLEEELTNYLIELDMDCEREKALVVSSLLSEF